MENNFMGDVMKSRRKQSLLNELYYGTDEAELTKAPLGNDSEIEVQEKSLWWSVSYGLRSILAIIICLVLPTLWYFDWRPVDIARQATQSVRGMFVHSLPKPLVELPLDPPAPVPLQAGIIDYLTQLKGQGLQEEFSMPAVRAFFENNVPVGFLKELQNANVLEELSFPAIVAFRQNKVPVSYLTQLEDAHLLDEFSFPAVVSFYQNNISLQYLNELHNGDLLEDFSFPGIVAFYQNQVPATFLQQLKTKDLLPSLSFPDIINMYHAKPVSN